MSTLRSSALVVTAIAATGSVASMLRVGGRAPLFLIVLFLGWVLSPFAAFVIADRMAAAWPSRARTIVYGAIVLISIASVGLYADLALRPPASTPAFRFVMVPVDSWIALAIAVAAGRAVSSSGAGKS